MTTPSDFPALPVPCDLAAGGFAAPARVNLIGEHTDYTGGFVLPMAISFRTTATIVAGDGTQYHFASATFESQRSMSPHDRSPRIQDWSDYPVGVLRQLQALGIHPPPFSLELAGDVPLGAGLSSSASIEVATAMALLAHAATALPPEQIALLCQRAENDFVGSPCGIMDQFVVTAAQAEHALLLNTRDLTYELLPMNRGGLAGCVIVVANSMVRHSIAGGDYGLRRREVEAGQNIVRAAFPALRDLGDTTLEQLESCEDSMSAESFLRCRHIVKENTRVLEAKAAMNAGDATWLGDAMTRSHISQRKDFECSVDEIDFLVDTALTIDGCYGARLTGGGFGGCTVNLVDKARADAFTTALKAAYRERFGIDAEMYICAAVDGAVAMAANHVASGEVSA